MRFNRITLLFFVFMASGFRLLTDAKWNTTSASPTLWVRYCADLNDKFISNNDLPTTDPLVGTNLSVVDALTSIRNNFNNIENSFIRLAAYPANPSSPPAPETGDDAFTTTLASTRTIDICSTTPTNPFQGGEARPVIEGSTITGCKITMSTKSLKSAKEYIGTLTHEIGHCLGLHHPQDTKKAIMSYHRDWDNYRLMIDDKMGIIFQYPKAGIDVSESATFGLSCAKR